jgi:hypothetical protein
VDYYQGVVTDYLRADRAMFVNTECCIQLNAAANPDTSGPHWYCDAVAINMRDHHVFLCEITYSKTLDALVTRLVAWSAHWGALRNALVRDLHVPSEWCVRPWVFIPAERQALLERKLARLKNDPASMPKPRVTPLEKVAPWQYRSWDRQPDQADELDSPACANQSEKRAELGDKEKT